MQESVDKQIQHEFPLAHAMQRSLFRRFVETDEYFSGLLAERVGEDVWNVGFVAEPDVEFLRLFGADEDERHLPVGKDGRGDDRIGKTRRFAPREIGYFNSCHLGLALARFLCCWIYLAEFDQLVVILATNLGDECALVGDIFGLVALPVAVAAYGTHNTEPLRAAGEAADKRGRTLVLATLHFDSYTCGCYHNETILAQEGGNCPWKREAPRISVSDTEMRGACGEVVHFSSGRSS